MAQRLLRATTALLLAAWTLPSLAATGTDARPDQPRDRAPISPSADRALPIGVIDPGAARNVDALPIDESAPEAPQDALQRPQGPRVEIMLRRIFEEAQARQAQLPQAQEDGDLNAALAAEKSETPEEPPRVLQADPAEAAAELPGLDPDERLRYRKQMYRTDI